MVCPGPRSSKTQALTIKSQFCLFLALKQAMYLLGVIFLEWMDPNAARKGPLKRPTPDGAGPEDLQGSQEHRSRKKTKGECEDDRRRERRICVTRRPTQPQP